MVSIFDHNILSLEILVKIFLLVSVSVLMSSHLFQRAV